MGMFAAPNTSAVMNSLPSHQRGAGSGMLNTFQNSAAVLSIGFFFTVITIGLASRLPQALLLKGSPRKASHTRPRSRPRTCRPLAACSRPSSGSTR
jgi:hypothetical protein